jgi:20S proteasome alpha/beta subunit
MTYYDTQGRYTQLDNLTAAINQNSASTGVFSCEDGILLFFEDPNKASMEILFNYKIHYTKNLLLVSTGIRGDSKYLLSIIKHYIRQWKYSVEEDVNPSYISNVLSQFIHSYTLRKSMRPLGSIILVTELNERKVYKIGVDSAFDIDTFFVVGKNSHKIESGYRQGNYKTMDETKGYILSLKADSVLQNPRIFKYTKEGIEEVFGETYAIN